MAGYIEQRGMKFTEAKKSAVIFRRTFGVNLDKYYSPFFGFDVIRFDEEVIKPPDGTSTYQEIIKRYGAEAGKLISALIKL